MTTTMAMAWDNLLSLTAGAPRTSLRLVFPTSISRGALAKLLPLPQETDSSIRPLMPPLLEYLRPLLLTKKPTNLKETDVFQNAVNAMKMLITERKPDLP